MIVHAPVSILRPLRAVRDYWQLPSAAKVEYRRDRWKPAEEDPGIERSISAGIAWLEPGSGSVCLTRRRSGPAL